MISLDTGCRESFFGSLLILLLYAVKTNRNWDTVVVEHAVCSWDELLEQVQI